ncbi:MAG: hypothetical protein ACRCZC_01365, partial [Culicoidibacterales bacterium]
MIYRYFETIESELLLQSYTFFSSNQLNVMKCRLDLERNPVRKHFTTYLQAIICFHQQNYVQANLLFAQIDVT